MATLTKNKVLPFQASETVKNLSSNKLSNDELDLPKHELFFGIEPKKLNKIDVFVTFEMKSAYNEGELKSNISNLANSYISTYKPSKAQLKKHRIIQNLQRNTNIAILKPNKGNAVVVIDRRVYDKEIMKLISDPRKFRDKRNFRIYYLN